MRAVKIEKQALGQWQQKLLFMLTFIWGVTNSTLLIASNNTINEVKNKTVSSTIKDEMETQGNGIHFLHTSWEEAVSQAKSQNKLIFVDFYTQWCGPCLNMAQEVFSLPSVGDYYNHTFINLKIDAENGEGVELAKKYGVRSYPTYAFIDPNTEELVHRSSSRQTPEQFIQTGKNANIPSRRSPYLESEYHNGNRDRQLLIDYINYKSTIYQREAVNTAFNELINGGAKLTDKDVWEVFVNTISGMTPYLKQVSDNYNEFCQLFTKKSVDAKLAKETQYGNLEEIEALCNFEGKEFNCKLIHINEDLRAQAFDKAAQEIDKMIADSTVNQQELIQRLKFIARPSMYRNVPEFWNDKCVEYLRYIAYNQADRDDAHIHQEYAAALENIIKGLQAGKKIPACLTTPPKHGKKAYTMRPDILKPKPIKKKK